MPVTLLNVETDDTARALVLRDEYCDYFEYELKKIGNENKNQFARRMMMEVLKEPIRELRRRRRAIPPITEPEMT